MTKTDYLTEQHQALAAWLADRGITWERLYRIELQRKDASDTRSGSSFGWHGPGESALFNDLQDRNIEQILDEVFDFLSDKGGEWIVRVLCGDGRMQKPVAKRIGGKGESFLFDHNARGDLVTLAREIHISIKDD